MSKEIISKFGDNPKTKIAWWAMWLGLSNLLIIPFLGIYAGAIRPLIDRTGGENLGRQIGFVSLIFFMILSLSAFIAGIRALMKGERTIVLYVGFIPTAFWIIMLIGEFVFPH